MANYLVTDKGTGKKRLISTDSLRKAKDHIFDSLFKVRTIEGTDEVADLIEAGVKREKIGATPEAKVGETGEGEAGDANQTGETGDDNIKGDQA
jgi:hypothetical protein